MRASHRRPKSVDKVTAGIVLTLAGIVVVITLAALTCHATPTKSSDHSGALDRTHSVKNS
jgi:hypothetical protein